MSRRRPGVSPRPTGTIESLGEFGLIGSIAAKVGKTPGIRLGIGDDAAMFGLAEGEEVLVSADLLIEDVHFRRRTSSARQVGRKSVAVNISDLAAMGATPRALVLSLALPTGLPSAWVRGFRDGFLTEAARYGAPLVGGDTTKSPGPIVINVTVLGSAHPAQVLTRSGARPGDRLWLCGEPGLSRVGLEVLESEARGFARARRAHREPQALPEQGRRLARSGRCSACIDVSDGLLGDLAHIARASGVGVDLELAALPLAAELRRWAKRCQRDPYDYVLNGGEDYALLFTLRDKAPAPGMRHAPAGFLRPIGTITAGEGIHLIHPDGSRTRAARGGFAHF